jgi:U3 small nucleolar ribonucleoprotein protein IMP3
MRRYHIQDREDYTKFVQSLLFHNPLYNTDLLLRYNKLCGSLRSFAHRVSLLPVQDPFRSRMEAQILSKLYDMGVVNSTAKLSDVDKLTVAAFCRRRLAVFMCMSKMSETVSAAAKFIEQGHVRVGPDTITDPAYLVSRRMEDFVTWVDTSKLKRTIMSYNDEVKEFSYFHIHSILLMCTFLNSWTTTIFYRWL